MEPQLERIKINNVMQWISTLGNPENEILLVLHGGPGLAGIPLYNKYLKPVSKTLFLVNWDQRGAGKSYSFSTPRNTMNLEQFLSDSIQVIDYLKRKYDKEKVFVLGHSWGSALGILLSQRCPDSIYKYLGVGQIGNWLKGEMISYNYILAEAIRLNSRKLEAKIKKIGKPPYNFKNLTRQRMVLLELGGALYGEKNYNRLIKVALRSQEYSLVDAIKYSLGLRFSLNLLWKDLNQIDLVSQVPEVHVPICFLIGRHDHQVPSECSLEYFETLIAPSKNWYWFEKSAHNPMFEETCKFLSILLLECST